MNYNIYLLEDESSLNQLLTSYLENEGWQVKFFHRGLEAENAISGNPHHHLQRALSRQQILNSIWEDDYIGTERVVDDLVRRLRKKLSELKIDTIYGYGYKLVNR
jgi:DNA-binding response OmpR family regulator